MCALLPFVPKSAVLKCLIESMFRELHDKRQLQVLMPAEFHAAGLLSGWFLLESDELSVPAMNIKLHKSLRSIDDKQDMQVALCRV